MAEDEIELRNCSHCDKEFPMDELEHFGEDSDFCEACAAAWIETFNACQHVFEYAENEFGDPGKVCQRCSGFVRDELDPAS
jgi:hypothetical protein